MSNVLVQALSMRSKHMPDELNFQSKGGIARAESLPPEKRSEIARKAAESRWSNVPQALTETKILRIGDADIPCAVLEDGRRVLTQEGVLHAIGRAKKAKG